MFIELENTNFIQIVGTYFLIVIKLDLINFQIQSFSQNPRLRTSDYELTENRGRLHPFRLSLDSSDEDSSMSSSFGQVSFIHPIQYSYSINLHVMPSKSWLVTVFNYYRFYYSTQYLSQELITK